MSEDQELLARIGRLAGQINQHKSQLTPLSRGGYASAPSHTSYGSIHRPHPGWAPYRGRGRPPSRRAAGPHRHRTLVLNNKTPNPDTADSSSSTTVPGDMNVEAKPPQQTGWVAKRDRHMQLINTAIYDQEAQARTKAIEETRKLKAQKKAELEKAKVLRFAQHIVAPTAEAAAAGVRPDSYKIVIQEIPFQVIKGGSKLIRLSNDPTAANATPKKVNVGGVTFVRSKNGNLHRLGAVVSKKKTGAVRKKDELCKRFTATGSCYKGPKCSYIHDPNKVAICKEFLQTGKCSAGPSCDLSHEPSPERSPACVHFIRGRCSNPACRYAHIRVTPGAPVCRDFAILGYCSKGDQCQDRHVIECPDYANMGKCAKQKCPLPHIDRAGQIRKLAANKADNNTHATENPGEYADDVSSEEEAYDEIDSDDVDSDELDDDEPEVIIPGAHAGEEGQIFSTIELDLCTLPECNMADNCSRIPILKVIPGVGNS
ncbi:zinc finger domain-containing protein [Coccidioides immitis RMSCC 2394]|uniref:Zinc finger domain-containing protein n=1 Tax=Coccidioides immitis RMSCC 2394 TaxID=404692 RepID=A0A0J6YJ52_COCIT|nr:zinc finger domain-containing protein [Coccidioides immitis RMSCC 2394]